MTLAPTASSNAVAAPTKDLAPALTHSYSSSIRDTLALPRGRCWGHPSSMDDRSHPAAFDEGGSWDRV